MSGKQRAAYKAWETRYKNIYGFNDSELYEFLEERYQTKIIDAEKKRVRDIIRELGGIHDKDYESIPIWAKRKTGRRLDEIALEVKDYLPEYRIENADDVYRLLNQMGA